MNAWFFFWEKKGVDAAFFPVSDTYEFGHLLDVNKIHYILASVDDDKSLLTHLAAEMEVEGLSRSDFSYWWNSINKSDRYDSEEVIFFKRMLQRELPLELRQKIFWPFVQKLGEQNRKGSLRRVVHVEK